MSILPARIESTIRIRWHRFLRYGIQTSQKRFPAHIVLFHWFLSLVVLNVAIRLSRFSTRPLLGIGRVSYALTNEFDTNQFWRGRHLIFVASSGRSGSGYLSSVLACADGTVSFHEPEPKMNGADIVNVLLNGKRTETLKERSYRKISAIREIILGTQRDVVYAETSHIFIKTFADVVLAEFGDMDEVKITIIVPERPVADVILSQLKLGWFAANHSGRNVWYYASPDLHETERKTNMTVDEDALSLAIGYNADISLRIRELRDLIRERHSQGRWDGVNMVDVSLYDIAPTKADKIHAFLTSLGLSPQLDKILLLKAQDENRRDYKKQVAHVNIDADSVHRTITRTWNHLAHFHVK